MDNDDNQMPRPKYADFNSTFERFCEVFKTKGSFRHYVFYAEANGLSGAISRLANGKKLIFDLDKLEEWIANGKIK